MSTIAASSRPGLLFCVALGLVAQGSLSVGWSPLLVALVAGLALGRLASAEALRLLTPGIDRAKRWLLPAGVALYALRIDMSWLVGEAGLQVLLVDAVLLTTTFVLAVTAGPRLLGMPVSQAALIGAGSAICGVSAILATAGTLRARGDEVTVAVATVAAFGLLAFFLHPLLWRVNAVFPFIAGGAQGYGAYIGATVHDVAQVVATASVVDAGAVESAVVAKLGRVAMLAPFLVLIARHGQRLGMPLEGAGGALGNWRGAMLLPALCLAAASVGTLLPAAAVQWSDEPAGICMSAAVFGLGFCTRFKTLVSAGRSAALLGALLLAWLLLGGALLHYVAGGAR
ncbi:MAG: putative sulfate exporter family transporter [Rubrivivax sp.]